MKTKSSSRSSSLLSLILRERKPIRSFVSLPETQKQKMRIAVDSCLMTSSFSPSQYNLQPTRYHHCYDEKRVQELYKHCFYTEPLRSAAGLILIMSDLHSLTTIAEALLQEDRARGAITEKEFRIFSYLIGMGFPKSQYLFGACFRRLLFPIIRFFSSLPEIPQTNYKSWLYKQAGIFTGTLFLELSSHNIDWNMVEFFDEKKVLALFSYPASRYSIPFLVSYGTALERSNVEKNVIEICLS
ncbi:MAG: nitroreductase family protein [Chlamydia sp.]